MNEATKVISILDNAIKVAKRKLYMLMLSKQTDKLTDNEIDLCYYLSKDDDIQEVLNKE